VPCAKADNGTPYQKYHISAVERHTGLPQSSRESAGRQQCAEHRLEAVREGQVGQPGGTDWQQRITQSMVAVESSG